MHSCEQQIVATSITRTATPTLTSLRLLINHYKTINVVRLIKLRAIMASSYEIYSDSDDDLDNGYNVDDAFINLSLQADTHDRGDSGQWRYLAHSDRGASIYGNSRTTILPSNQFKLAFNAADEIQCSKFKIENRHSYNASKRKLRLKEDPFRTCVEYNLNVCADRCADR